MIYEDEKLLSYLYKLVDKQADQYAETLVSKVVRELRKIKVTLSADDSVLANCWDEICVQEQDERFWAWDEHVKTIELVISGCFEEMGNFEQECVNFAALQKPSADVDDGYGYDAIYMDYIVAFIFELVSEKAKSYTNVRIRKYLEPNFGVD